MIIAVDFDNTVVVQDGRDYEDVTTPLEFMPWAKEALHALKAAGHVLLLYSCRANRALLEDPALDPLVRAGVKRINITWWQGNQPINQARYDQMVAFVAEELPGVFAAIDDGMQGKASADLYLDDKALQLGYGPYGAGWADVMKMHGEAGGQDGER